jgi:integrase/recombinase XerD
MKTIEGFIEDRQYLKNVSPRTIEFYWDCFKSVQKHGDFTSEGLKKWIIGSRKAGVSAASINTRITGINAFLKWAGESYKLTLLKEEERVLPTYPVEHLKRLIDFKPKTFYHCRLYALILTILDTGLRVEECLGLKISEIDYDNMVFRVRGKGNKERIIAFSHGLRKVLYAWSKKHEHLYLFPTADGGRLMRRNVLRDFKLLCKRLGFVAVPRSIHALRHTFAANYLRQGGSVFHLQKALGHTSLEMSRRYANMLTEDLQEVQQKVSLLNRMR